jgi:broad specificity phosphatase PhoE
VSASVHQGDLVDWRTEYGMSGTRYLYLVRHGEALADESGLTESGRRQAVLIGKRLKGIPFSVVHHSPLARAAETASLIGQQLKVSLQASEVVGDYVPYLPERDKLPADSADYLLGFLRQFTAEEHGPELARLAIERFTGPVESVLDQRELVVTHSFLIAWLVRHALDAPPWRWLGLNHCNAALTVLRYAPGRPSTVVMYNDMRHLPADLRWTGFPTKLRT